MFSKRFEILLMWRNSQEKCTILFDMYAIYDNLTHDSNPLFPFMMHMSIVLDYQSISSTNTFAKTHGTALSPV
jgi:hypothetical protein